MARSTIESVHQLSSAREHISLPAGSGSTPPTTTPPGTNNQSELMSTLDPYPTSTLWGRPWWGGPWLDHISATLCISHPLRFLCKMRLVPTKEEAWLCQQRNGRHLASKAPNYSWSRWTTAASSGVPQDFYIASYMLSVVYIILFPIPRILFSSTTISKSKHWWHSPRHHKRFRQKLDIIIYHLW